MSRARAVNAFLQAYFQSHPDVVEVTAVEAAELLDGADVLRDRKRGLPLRNLLRAGQICGAEQLNGRWWVIRPAARPPAKRPGGETQSGAKPASGRGSHAALVASREVLPDVLEPRLAVVFVGESAGRKSAKIGAYYAGQRNRFWDELADSGITACRLPPSEFRQLPEYGVGLTDFWKGVTDVDVKSGWKPSREQLCKARDHLLKTIKRCKPVAVCFLGRNASRLFFGWTKRCRPVWGLQKGLLAGTSEIWLCPSTSGSAGAVAAERREVLTDLYGKVIKPWQELRT